MRLTLSKTAGSQKYLGVPQIGESSRRSRSRQLVLFGLLLAVAGVSCGGSSVGSFEEEEARNLGGMDSGGSGGEPSPTGGVSATGGDGTGATSDYVEEECPDEPPPPPDEYCDPFGDSSECGAGYSCVPYLIYPDGERCAKVRYGTGCAQSGSSVQGESCESGGGCASGHICVVGAVAGKRCGKLCVPGAQSDCSPGLICGETDVPGYGVCF